MNISNYGWMRFSLLYFAVAWLVFPCLLQADQTDDRLLNMVQYNVDNPWPDPLSATADTRAWGTACYALAALYANTNVATANSYIETFHNDFLFTETETGDFTAYFKLHFLWRIYCDTNMNARLTVSARDKIEDLMWRWINQRSRISDATNSVWRIHDSENHDALRKGGYLLCAQALKGAGSPYGPDVTLADGYALTEHADAWTAYFLRYFNTRAKEGINCEIASPIYAKYSVGVYYNIRDYAESALLRELAEKFITLYWADTASDWTRSGVRGGAETRCYKDNYLWTGSSYAFDDLLWGYGWHETAGNVRTYGLMPATSDYRVPDSITACAADTNRPNFLYTSRRFGLGGAWVNEVYTVLFDNGDSHIRRETYVTPDYTMGTFTVDMNRDYIALTDQNRAMGVMFASGVNDRIMICGEGGSDPTKSFADLNGVTRTNCMVVQRDKNANSGGDEMFIFVSSNVWTTSVETNGWVFTQAGSAYGGVKPSAGGYAVSNTAQGVILRCPDMWAPFVFQMGQASNYTDFAAFQVSVQSNALSYASGTLTYTSEAGDTFTVYGNTKTTPRVNGVTVDLNPAKVYDSPNLSMLHGEEVATFTYGAYSNLMLDFSLPIALEVTTGSGAQGISNGVARLNGDVTITSDVTIYWDAIDRGTNGVGWARSEVLGSVAAGAFSADISNLVYGLGYCYRCFASNTLDGATAWSDLEPFVPTPMPLSGISVVNADSIVLSDTSADGNPYDLENVAYTHLFNSGAATKLVVTVSSEQSGDGAVSITYNGQAMTLAAPGSGRAMGVWYLDNPYTGGVANLTVDMSSITTVNGIGLAAVSISGAAPGFATNAVSTTNSIAVSAPLTNSFVMVGYGNNNGVSVAAAVPLTQIYSGSIGSAMGCAGYHLVSSAGSNTYSFASADQSAARTVAAVFAPVVEDDVSRLDANADGIADAWTVLHFSSDPFVAGLDGSDPDGDGVSNVDEYIAGSDPTNGVDVFEVGIVNSNGELVVSIPTRLTSSMLYGVLTRNYGLESNTNLLGTNWVLVTGVEDIPATGLPLLHTNIIGETKAYYRAKVWLDVP